MNHVTGIEHLAIFAHDSKELKDWYIAMFDFTQVYDNGKGTYFLKAQNGMMIEFLTAEDERSDFNVKTAGIRHVAIGVTMDGFEAVVEKLRAANVEVVTEPAAGAGYKTFFFRDIAGNICHLIARDVAL